MAHHKNQCSKHGWTEHRITRSIKRGKSWFSCIKCSNERNANAIKRKKAKQMERWDTIFGKKS